MQAKPRGNSSNWMDAGLHVMPYPRVNTGHAIPAGRPETIGGQQEER